jgi:succinyl-diaminopimelate desuccinylase
MTSADVISLAERLIQIQSIADKPNALREALQIIESRLSSVDDITIELFEDDGIPSLLAYCGKTRPDCFGVLLNGHLDVVSADKDQFLPHKTDTHLYGRGALDMKTTVAAMVELFIEHAPRLPFGLGLQIVTDEEVGGAHGTKYQLAQGITADFAIIGEWTPADSICIASRGYCWAELHFRGKTAHSAYAWQGNSALLEAARFVEAVSERFGPGSVNGWETTANIASFCTPNVAFNKVPDVATVRVDFRFVEGDSNFAGQTATLQLLKELAPAAETTLHLYEPGHATDKEDPHVISLAQAIRKVIGTEIQYIRKPGAADVRYFSQHGIPAVVYGLEGNNPHGPAESVHIASIDTYLEALTHFLYRTS